MITSLIWNGCVDLQMADATSFVGMLCSQGSGMHLR